MVAIPESQLMPPARRRGAFRLWVVAVVALIGVALGGAFFYSSLFAVKDYSGRGSGSVVVQVAPGDTAGDIGDTLLASGVVKSARAFTRAAKSDSRSRSLQPGSFTLRRHMSGASALALLLDPTSRLRSRVTLPEGRPLATTIGRIASDTEVARADLVSALAKPGTLGLPSYAGGKPEGFLFPSTYDVEPGTGAVEVLRQLTQRFADEAAALDLETGAKALRISPYDVVKVASIVEAETPLDSDRAKVARVVYNRLARGMPLQLDSTVNYLRAERAARLSLADISVSSPYNTYRHKGLPPTPIDSPGRKALEAALHPAKGDFLYFITIDKAGHSLFTASYPEFQRAKAKAKRDGVY